MALPVPGPGVRTSIMCGSANRPPSWHKRVENGTVRDVPSPGSGLVAMMTAVPRGRMGEGTVPHVSLLNIPEYLSNVAPAGAAISSSRYAAGAHLRRRCMRVPCGGRRASAPSAAPPRPRSARAGGPTVVTTVGTAADRLRGSSPPSREPAWMHGLAHMPI
eukprot:scaffold2319_cov406-Prasinococcus_capsulatus_cf.AAC.4